MLYCLRLGKVVLMLFEKIVECCKKKNITQKEFLEIMGLTHNTLTKWKNGAMPSAYVLLQVARFFDTSVEYLLTGEEKGITLEEQELLRDYNSLDESHKEIIKANIQMFKEIKN